MKIRSQIYLYCCTALFAVALVCMLLLRHFGSNLISISLFDAPTTTYATQDKSIVSGKLNINTATAEELTMLPGIGEVLAQRIVDYRSNNGKFKDIQELIHIKGIGNAKLSAISAYITTGG